MKPETENLLFEREAVYGRLEEKFLTYSDLKSVPVRDNGEALVDLSSQGISTCIYDAEICASTGDTILARAGVAERLKGAQFYLQQIYPNYRLQVFYGYRSPPIQSESFDKIRIKMGFGNNLSDDQKETIHRYIAVPDVAGHPTGGAVDVTVIDSKNQILDMGTALHAFEKDSYTFSPFISRDAWANRQLLRSAMMSANFAPFDGEWWHFSYGDREWAKYYRKQDAIYGGL